MATLAAIPEAFLPVLCVICLEDVEFTDKYKPFACSVDHPTHPHCGFKAIIAKGDVAPTCLVCTAGLKKPVGDLPVFPVHMTVEEDRVAFFDAGPALHKMAHGVFPEIKGFLVAGPFPFTNQDFGHSNECVIETHASKKYVDKWPLVAWRYEPRGAFGRVMTEVGDVVLFDGEVYKWNPNGSVYKVTTAPSRLVRK